MMDWQPIESIPHDGTHRLLLYGQPNNWYMILGCWFHAQSFGAKYWMPLPDPPTQESTAEETRSRE